MSDQRELYERDREDPYYEGRHTHRKEGFFERNCDEAWEQVKETFSHPGRLFAKVLLIALQSESGYRGSKLGTAISPFCPCATASPADKRLPATYFSSLITSAVR